jgi:lysophospholipase L1-like esterase
MKINLTWKQSNIIVVEFKSIVYKILLIISLLLYSNISFEQGNSQFNHKGFRAAVVKVNITPEDSQYMLGYGPRKSTAIRDSIYHRIVVMDDGKMQFALVSTDICICNCAEYDRIALKISKELGISPQNFWWTTTHTHSAPEVGPAGLDSLFLGDRYDHDRDAKYAALVENRMINGIRQAQKDLKPAKLGVGWGYSQANINRRAKDIDDVAFLGMDPDGATDRKIGIIRLDKVDGSPLAIIANYPIHGTCLGGTAYISGDVPGVVSEYVQQQLGVPCLFINGAAGNLAPIYSVGNNVEDPFLNQFRTLLGDKILEANSKIITNKEVKLYSQEIVVETPRKKDLGWPFSYGKYTRTTLSGENMVRIPIQFLKINDDIAIWNGPCEMFCEISNEVRSRSPFPYTFYYGYANGWLGYVPTEEEWKYKGYEPSVSPFTPIAAKDITESVVGVLQGKLYSHEALFSNDRYLIGKINKNLRNIRYDIKPSVGIIGNSTVAEYAGEKSVATLINESGSYLITDISRPGYTIQQEDSLWRELPSDVKKSLDYVFIQIGLNDLNPEESFLKALERYQSLINIVRRETRKSCRIITSTMTPCKQRLIDLYGNSKGLVAYKKWIDMNTAITGDGPNKLINFDSYCSSSIYLMSDGEGNLAAAYDTGDGIHESTLARQIIANEWISKLMWYNERK